MFSSNASRLGSTGVGCLTKLMPDTKKNLTGTLVPLQPR
jgi:hypothetical protein